MLSSCDVMAFVATRDAKRAKRFYEEVLGLALTGEDDFALTFEACGTMLRVQIVENHVAVPFTVLGWSVPDIAAAVRDLGARGVAFQRYPFMEQDASGVWTAPGGARVAWFNDPDGNTLSLTQLAR